MRPEIHSELFQKRLVQWLWQPVYDRQKSMEFNRELTVWRDNKKFSGYPK
jgi:hypothetical protein